MRSVLCAALFLTLANCAHGDEAEQAWLGLVDQKYHNSQAFKLPTYNPELPSVFIYGDSISMGYQRYVQQGLEGKANVYRIYTNGGDSSTLIPKLKKLQQTMAPFIADERWPATWDVIHVNVGLHDLKYAKDGKLVNEGGTQVHSSDEYQQHLAAALDYLQELAPQAKIIFATTTPVPENSFGRTAGDAARYNQAAREVLQRYPQVGVNDLYEFTKPRQSEWWTSPGNVHFTAKGQKAQGKQVAEVIEKALKDRRHET
ncbi:SGNH/GDSL hydrolase family protein [Aeoliella sp. ICT_H6.2]|uniref:SGNH/GDSL hydrolase family protein n=1 Tax=Aeoliella straminimaris TaxID=2954799 RepID=A0A9X2FDB9_9BACT|nr:SGNH/GDSL hydrolase family protein [Aeoliella straminimaris]MCO6046860.1 SGNH/GDSL hydrolase family protein [Aeoliella straminimaris]